MIYQIFCIFAQSPSILIHLLIKIDECDENPSIFLSGLAAYVIEICVHVNLALIGRYCGVLILSTNRCAGIIESAFSYNIERQRPPQYPYQGLSCGSTVN